jgi:hypothetical protein
MNVRRAHRFVACSTPFNYYRGSWGLLDVPASSVIFSAFSIPPDKGTLAGAAGMRSCANSSALPTAAKLRLSALSGLFLVARLEPPVGPARAFVSRELSKRLKNSAATQSERTEESRRCLEQSVSQRSYSEGR